MKFNIDAIDFELGETTINLSKIIPDFDRTYEKTGIAKAFSTADFAYELGLKAAHRAIQASNIPKEEIRFLIYVTQSLSKTLPGDSVFIHKGLELPKGLALYDLNAGCSGFAQALFLAAGLVSTLGPGIIVCGDKYRSKLSDSDRSTRAVFSDAASAVIISPGDDFSLRAHSFEVETINGPSYLFQELGTSTQESTATLNMNGPALWTYTRSNVVGQINEMIKQSHLLGLAPTRVYLHQASKLVVDGIASRLMMDNLEVPRNYQHVGNCVSSSLPILIANNLEKFRKSTSILAGFGVGIMSVCLLIQGAKK